MTLREGVTYVVVVVILLLAVVFYRRATDAEKGAQEQRTRLARRAKDLQEELRAECRRVEEASKKAPGLEEAPLPTAVPQDPPRQEAFRTEESLQVEEAVQRKARFNESMRPQFRPHIEKVYGELMQSWGLGEEATTRIKEAMVDCWLARMQSGSIPADVLERERRKTVVDFCKLVTAQQLADLRYYEAEQRLVGLGLDEVGLRVVCSVLTAEERLPYEGEQGDLASWRAERRESNERILIQVRSVLTEEQYGELKRRLEVEPPRDEKE